MANWKKYLKWLGWFIGFIFVVADRAANLIGKSTTIEDADSLLVKLGHLLDWLTEQNPNWVLFVGIGLLVVCTALIYDDLRKFWSVRNLSPSYPNANAEVPQAIAVPKIQLTQDQRDFRVELKKFALNYPTALQMHLGKVIEIVRAKEREMNYNYPSSIAINFFAHHDTTQNLCGQRHLSHLGPTQIEDMNVEETQREFSAFLNDYYWRQKALGAINEIAKIDLENLKEVKEWLALDREARNRCLDMKAWAEADAIKDNHDDKWASTGDGWKQQDKEGYR